MSLSCLHHVKRGDDGSRPMAPAPYVINTFVGDRSGSMQTMHEQLKRGVRDYTRDMREMAQSGTKVRFELYAFDDKINRPFNGDPKNLVEQDIDYLTTHFTPNGTTRLYDTVIQAIQSQKMAEKNILENLTPSEQKVFRQLDVKVPKVLSVMTDGQDNSSIASVRKMRKAILDHRKNGATCIFVGANFDAQQAADVFGFAHDTTLQMTPGHQFADNAFVALRQCSQRSTGGLAPSIPRLQRESSVSTGDAIRYNVTRNTSAPANLNTSSTTALSFANRFGLRQTGLYESDDDIFGAGSDDSSSSEEEDEDTLYAQAASLFGSPVQLPRLKRC